MSTAVQTTRRNLIQLPARTEGSHCWLWLLLYLHAEADLPPSADAGRRTQAAGLLWDQVVAGSLSVKRDRSGLTNVTDSWLPDLIAAESRRHLALSARLERAGDPGARRPVEAERSTAERLDAVAQFIWMQLGNGWARVADDVDAILFWDPESETFVVFDLELSAAYARRSGRRAAL